MHADVAPLANVERVGATLATDRAHDEAMTRETGSIRAADGTLPIALLRHLHDTRRATTDATDAFDTLFAVDTGRLPVALGAPGSQLGTASVGTRESPALETGLALPLAAQHTRSVQREAAAADALNTLDAFRQWTPVFCQLQAPPFGARRVQRRSELVKPQHLSPFAHLRGPWPHAAFTGSGGRPRVGGEHTPATHLFDAEQRMLAALSQGCSALTMSVQRAGLVPSVQHLRPAW